LELADQALLHPTGSLHRQLDMAYSFSGAPHLWPSAPRAQTGIYIALGWAVLPYAGAVQAALGPAGAALLIAGGVAYSVGGVIYAARWPDPVPKRAPAARALPGRLPRRCRAQLDACAAVIAVACAYGVRAHACSRLAFS